MAESYIPIFKPNLLIKLAAYWQILMIRSLSFELSVSPT